MSLFCVNPVNGLFSFSRKWAVAKQSRENIKFHVLYTLFFRYDKYNNRSIHLQRHLVYLHFHVATIALCGLHNI